jgi:prevent-host-death family protein
MHEQTPMTQTMKISEVKTQLNSLVNRVYRKEARVLVEKSGIPVAALVSTADLARLDRLDQERAERFTVLDEMRAAFTDVPPEETERETDRITAEIRAESRRREEAAAKR